MEYICKPLKHCVCVFRVVDLFSFQLSGLTGLPTLFCQWHICIMPVSILCEWDSVAETFAYVNNKMNRKENKRNF